MYSTYDGDRPGIQENGALLLRRKRRAYHQLRSDSLVVDSRRSFGFYQGPEEPNRSIHGLLVATRCSMGSRTSEGGRM